MPKHLIGVNNAGRRVGEYHPLAILSDHDVELLIGLRDSDPVLWSYSKLAVKFDISKSQARNIIKGRQRAQRAERYKTCT